MATRTVTNTDYISAITVPGDVTVDTVDAKTGTFSGSVEAPVATFTHLRANTASIDVIQEHIVTDDSIIELDTGNAEDKRTSGIITKYVSEIPITLGETKYAGLLREAGGGFHLVDDKELPDPDTDPATLAKADLTVKQLRTSGNILPSTSGTLSLGNETQRFSSLHLGRTLNNNTGNIHLGIGATAGNTNTAHMFLHSAGDGFSQIHFGRDAVGATNTKWILSSRISGESNAFELFRGPYLTDDNKYQRIWSVSGVTGRVYYVIDTDATNSTTAPVTYAGGVGIAKSLHVGTSITSNSITTGDLKVTGTLDIGSVTLDDLKLSSSILALDTENADDLRTSGVVSKYVTGGATRYAGLLRKAGGGFHLVDAPSLPDLTTDPTTLPRSSLSVQLLNVNGGTFRLDGSRNNVLAGSRVGSSMYNTWSNPPQRLIAIGSDILDNTWSPNEWSVVAIGHDIMNTAGVDEKRVAGSIAIGTRALKSYVGHETLPFPCIAIGRDAMRDSTEAYGSVAIGTDALRFGTPRYAVAIGQDSAKTGTHDYGVCIGYRAGESAGGSYNTGVGYLALSKSTGSNNTSVGSNSLQRATGHSNVGIGQGAGAYLTTGSNNTFVGSGTGVPNGSPFVAHCTAIGSGITTNHSNTAVIGSGDVSNVLFGHSNTATAGAGSATLGTVAHPVKGIYLASPDGTPALLNRYESFNVITTISGPWTGEKPFLIRITVIGPQVFISAQRGLYSTEQNASLIATAGGSIPERLRPGIDDDVTQVITGISNAGVETLGKVSVTPAGILTISPDPVGNGGWNHIAGGAVRWGRLNFSYTLA